MRPDKCNTCGRSCKGNVIRDRFGNFKQTRKCPGHISLYPMRISLLEQASKYKGFGQVLHEILKSTNLRMVKHNVYPKFAFLDSKTKQLIRT